ncbi:hypothetical protein Q8F55_008617 [Vanrija albida]|uniref:DNA mismatch repair proteins mutS family domain-containing protein n=1 Tax=Vanrija albida TaxID=181172 RepID=A0ABR3PRB6_9TREE
MLADLPTSKLDDEGNTVGPLEAFIDTRPSRTKKDKSKEPPEPAEPSPSGQSTYQYDEAEFLAAVEAGTVPDTRLARVVWTNWKRFPDCILLTQVGQFYESYFEPAVQLSRVLGIKLTSKTYKDRRSFPFAGFPTHQRDKYLKLLVQDLGYTVVLVEEDKDPRALPSKVDKDIPRKVARIVTPGTLVDESWLGGNESRYLLAITMDQSSAVDGEDTASAGADTDADADPNSLIPLHLAYADVSTGDFFIKETTVAQIEDELTRIAPREVVLDARLREVWLSSAKSGSSAVNSLMSLLRVLGVHVSFASPTREEQSPAPSITNLEREVIAILRHHLQYALRDSMPAMPENADEFNRESSSAQMQIDAATLHALEIRHALRPGGLVATGTSTAPMGLSASPLSVRGTLLSVISRTVTDSGHRLLKRTLSAPSTSLPLINSRLSLVAAFVEREPLRTDLRDALRSMGDIMRIIQRFRANRGDASDVWDVALWIRSVQSLVGRVQLAVDLEPKSRKKRKDGGQVEGRDRLIELIDDLAPLTELATTIEKAIDQTCIPSAQMPDDGSDDASSAAENGGDTPPKPSRSRFSREEEVRKREEEMRALWWIRPKFSPELDDLHRRLTRYSAAHQKMELEMSETYNAPTLMLVRNIVHGFVVNVRKKTEYGLLERSGLVHTVGETRSGGKKYAYTEWSKLGHKIDKARQELEMEKARALAQLRALVVEQASAIQHNAELVDEIDLTAGFAQAAVDLNYKRPVLHEGTSIAITNGRHPSVEAGLRASARMFTPNSTIMNSTSHMHIITGPNQGGKSTLLRQTAVIAILAQAGSFVPADHAEIGVVDRVFSRIGARDDLFRDRSTFMLEMVETAAILKQATPRSLILMDEIGRGTTLDAGMSIAYATLDYILQHIGCRTLFATHYHELATMLGAPAASPTSTHVDTSEAEADGRVRDGVRFFCTDVDEMDGAFSYSYRLRPGVNYDSHAIKAAQLAGMPASFLATAEATLATLGQLQHKQHPAQ